MKTALYNQEGKTTGTVELPKSIFETPFKKELVQEVAEIQRSRRRQVSAHVKGRGDVAGGGRKPWRQKGTGRARHGSIRSPIWVGGGVTHGPSKERNFKKNLNKKVKRSAFFSVLAEKARQNLLVVVETLELQEAKTKALRSLLNTLPANEKNTLIVLPKADKAILRSAGNLPGVKVAVAKDLNALDVLRATYVVMPQETLSALEKTFAK